MTDQQRFDTIASLGNELIYTPNLDRLVRRGSSFPNAYSTCPVCVPARYTIRTGCEPPRTAIFANEAPHPAPGQHQSINGRCGPYLALRMRELGYRTFGIGKFHTSPRDEDLGYDYHEHSEELYRPGQRATDSYARWIADVHPYYDFQEGLMGERTEMYYVPQMSHVPAEAGVEHWAAERAVEQIAHDDGRSFFGFVSFVGPHPPFAPPIPFNRMYDPDRMGTPLLGDIQTDHMDQQIPWMNRIIWAEEINEPWFSILKARYYGEISYIDWCIGKILDSVDERDDADNTLICFFSDHGEHLGDHHAWQKESFFEESCRIPFLLSWPERVASNSECGALACLADLFGIATGAAGDFDARDGVDLLRTLTSKSAGRNHLVGYHGRPGTRAFKMMVRRGEWKFIYLANGGMEQLFHLREDPNELQNLASLTDVEDFRSIALHACKAAASASTKDGELVHFPFAEFVPEDNPYGNGMSRIYQFDASRGVSGFPKRPSDVMAFFDD